MSAPIVSEAVFQEMMTERLGDQLDRSQTVLRNYGPYLSFDVTNVLYQAADQGPDKVDEVLNLLEEHFNDHLSYQHPDARGTVTDNLLGVNPTHTMFISICSQTLGLKRND